MADRLRSQPAAGAEPGPAPQAPDPRRWKALILLCVTAFMVILDSQIVILALPTIEQELRFAPGGGQWVLSAYMLAFGGLLLFGGRLADLRGRRQMFVAGTVLFGVSSLLCGLAWSAGVLVGARVIQGVSAAIMAPAALAILMTTFPDGPERNKALAFYSTAGGLGATAALLIGGPVTGSLGWEWIFYLNVPVAAGLLVLAPVLLLESRDRDQARAYDPAGAFTITLGLMLLIGAIVQAPTEGWTSGSVVGMLLGAVVLVALFVVVESRSAAPLMPLRLFRSRLFVGGNLAMVIVAMTALGMGTTVSAYAQRVLGYTPMQFGLGTTVMTLMTLVGAYAGQAGVTKAGFRPVAAVGFALMGIGAFLLSQVPADGTYLGDLFPGLLSFGLGLGAGPLAAVAAALSSVDEEVAGVASGANNAAFQIGGALGAAVVSGVVVSQVGDSTVPTVLAEGFQAGFTTDLVIALTGLCVALVLLRPLTRRTRDMTSAGSRAEPPEGPPHPQPDKAPSLSARRGLTMGQPVVHFEIIGNDPAKLRGYYGELFGWEFHTGDATTEKVSQPGTYGFVDGHSTGEGGINGGIGGGQGHQRRVLFYVSVPDVESALQHAERLGGERVMGPEPESGEFTVGHFTDPEGNVTGVAGPSA